MIATLFRLLAALALIAAVAAGDAISPPHAVRHEAIP